MIRLTKLIVVLQNTYYSYIIILMPMRQEQEILLQLLEHQTFDSYLLSIQIIQNIIKGNRPNTEQFQRKISEKFKSIQNIPLLIYLSQSKYDFKNFYFSKDPYIEKYHKIVSSLGSNVYQNIIQQLEISTAENKYNFSCYILTYLPTFFIDRLTEISTIDLFFLLAIFDMLDIQGPKQIEIVHKALQNLQTLMIKDPNKENSKETNIIVTAISVIKHKQNGTGNISLIIDDYLLGNVQKGCMKTFCNIYRDAITQFTGQQLLNILKNLFKSTISLQSLIFLKLLTFILIDNEEFFKLKEIFSKFLIPNLIKFGKTCRKIDVSELILQISEIYINGFRMQFSIDDFGIECFLFNFQNVVEQKYRKKLLSLLFLIIQQQNSKWTVGDKLLRKGIQKEFINQCLGVCHEVPWEITNRNIRQHKMYRKLQSNYKGIKNRSIQCYIISNIQALFTTKHLPNLLRRCSVRTQFINSLTIAFKALQQKSLSKIAVNDIQRFGPSQFARSGRQQDAQLYLLGLFDKIEDDLKKTQFLQQFKDIYQIRSITQVICQRCGFTTTCKQSEYIHSVYYKEKIQFAKEEIIQDFSCQKCGNRKSLKKTRIDSRSEILIVHINRFSNSNGVMRKMLPTQKIQRKIDSYQLTGMIFHIGKEIQYGHYVYYSKLSKRRWIQFNDQQVTQFILQEESQQFERQFKAEKTPYILFYVKTK